MMSDKEKRRIRGYGLKGGKWLQNITDAHLKPGDVGQVFEIPGFGFDVFVLATEEGLRANRRVAVATEDTAPWEYGEFLVQTDNHQHAKLPT